MENTQSTFVVGTTSEAVTVSLSSAILCEKAVLGLRLQLGRLVEESGKALHLDLQDVVVPTAGGLGRLVALHKQLQAVSNELVLCNVGGQAYEVFQRTGLTDLLDIRPKDGLAI